MLRTPSPIEYYESAKNPPKRSKNPLDEDDDDKRGGRKYNRNEKKDPIYKDFEKLNISRQIIVHPIRSKKDVKVERAESRQLQQQQNDTRQSREEKGGNGKINSGKNDSRENKIIDFSTKCPNEDAKDEEIGNGRVTISRLTRHSCKSPFDDIAVAGHYPNLTTLPGSWKDKNCARNEICTEKFRNNNNSCDIRALGIKDIEILKIKKPVKATAADKLLLHDKEASTSSNHYHDTAKNSFPKLLDEQAIRQSYFEPTDFTDVDGIDEDDLTRRIRELRKNNAKLEDLLKQNVTVADKLNRKCHKEEKRYESYLELFEKKTSITSSARER